jgi:hypothetical protein
MRPAARSATPPLTAPPSVGEATYSAAFAASNPSTSAKSWPDAWAEDRHAGTSLAETIERIRWRLWHGQVRRSLDLIGETMATLEATAESASCQAS